ncbi:uncharacterized protein LOC134830732 [Culicoides brevitarsis]|uniref:uncharacterized protein LOC134830732 n=1 Tax=Culicoides brevitarsis TaxID=469753 RepID=UPI00307C5A5C
MGVHKLDFYINKTAPAGIKKEISIKEEIVDYCLTCDKEPLIVVDLTYFLCGGPSLSREEQLCGGRANRFLHNVKSFFVGLRNLGARLAFFANAYTKDEDFEQWIEKAEARYQKEIAVLEYFYHGATLEDVTKFCLSNKIYVSLQKVTNQAVFEIARDQGRIFKMHNLPQAVATYANVNKAFAVLGNNSDYNIYGGEWRYWNAGRLFMRDMNVVQVEKRLLREHLGLTEDQMPIFATMMGNHIIPEEAVKEFHEIIQSEVLVEKIASIISQSTDAVPTGDDTKIMMSLAFEDDFDQDLIRKSLKHYKTLPTFEVPKVSDNKLINQLYYESDLFSYQVLNEKVLYTSLQFVDLRKTDIPLYSELALTLRRKCVGILVKNKPGGKHQQTFVIKTEHEEPFSMVKLDPIFPECLVPSLKDLFMPLILKTASLEYKMQRYDLLKFVISEKLTQPTIDSIPKQYLATAVTIFYMFENKCLTVDEADIFTLSTYAAVMKKIPTKLAPPETLNHRAFRLTFMFLRLSEHIKRAFVICGLSQLVDETCFDGFHFHATYEKFMQQDFKQKEKMMSNTASYVQLYRTLNDLPTIGGLKKEKSSERKI